MRGSIQAIQGCETRYPPIALQHILQRHYNAVYNDRSERIRFYPLVVTPGRLACIAGRPLCERDNSAADYVETSLSWLRTHGVIDEHSNLIMEAPVAALLWELRSMGAESMPIILALPVLMEVTKRELHESFRGLARKGWSRVKMEKLEADLLAMLLPVVDREKPLNATQILSRDPALLGMTARLQAVQAVCLATGADVEIDASLYWLLVQRRPRSTMPVQWTNRHWFNIKGRMWRLGSVVRLMHNCLNVPGSQFDTFVILLRKTFRRIQWTMRDTFEDR
jgi:hypothetical protein